MALEYINYIQTENLVKHWNTLQGIRDSLKSELNSIGTNFHQNEIDDYVYTKVVGNKVLSDTPPSGKISDTTGNTAISYKDILDKDICETIECIEKEKFRVDLVSEKLEISYQRLSKTQLQILNLFYWEHKTWKETLEELKSNQQFMSKQQAQAQRRTALYKIQKISKITTENYEMVMKLVEVE